MCGVVQPLPAIEYSLQLSSLWPPKVSEQPRRKYYLILLLYRCFSCAITFYTWIMSLRVNNIVNKWYSTTLLHYTSNLLWQWGGLLDTNPCSFNLYPSTLWILIIVNRVYKTLAGVLLYNGDTRNLKHLTFQLLFSQHFILLQNFYK